MATPKASIPATKSGGSKFASLNLNAVHKRAPVVGVVAAPKQTPKGLVALGLPAKEKKNAPKFEPPKPVQLKSLRAENQGLDPTISLVPAGGPGWGKKAEAKTPESGPASDPKEPLPGREESLRGDRREHPCDQGEQRDDCHPDERGGADDQQRREDGDYGLPEAIQEHRPEPRPDGGLGEQPDANKGKECEEDDRLARQEARAQGEPWQLEARIGDRTPEGETDIAEVASATLGTDAAVPTVSDVHSELKPEHHPKEAMVPAYPSHEVASGEVAAVASDDGGAASREGWRRRGQGAQGSSDSDGRMNGEAQWVSVCHSKADSEIAGDVGGTREKPAERINAWAKGKGRAAVAAAKAAEEAKAAEARRVAEDKRAAEAAEYAAAAAIRREAKRAEAEARAKARAEANEARMGALVDGREKEDEDIGKARSKGKKYKKGMDEQESIDASHEAAADSEAGEDSKGKGKGKGKKEKKSKKAEEDYWQSSATWEGAEDGKGRAKKGKGRGARWVVRRSPLSPARGSEESHSLEKKSDVLEKIESVDDKQERASSKQFEAAGSSKPVLPNPPTMRRRDMTAPLPSVPTPQSIGPRKALVASAIPAASPTAEAVPSAKERSQPRKSTEEPKPKEADRRLVSTLHPVLNDGRLNLSLGAGVVCVLAEVGSDSNDEGEAGEFETVKSKKRKKSERDEKKRLAEVEAKREAKRADYQKVKEAAEGEGADIVKDPRLKRPAADEVADAILDVEQAEVAAAAAAAATRRSGNREQVPATSGEYGTAGREVGIDETLGGASGSGSANASPALGPLPMGGFMGFGGFGRMAALDSQPSKEIAAIWQRPAGDAVDCVHGLRAQVGFGGTSGATVTFSGKPFRPHGVPPPYSPPLPTRPLLLRRMKATTLDAQALQVAQEAQSRAPSFAPASSSSQRLAKVAAKEVSGHTADTAREDSARGRDSWSARTWGSKVRSGRGGMNGSVAWKDATRGREEEHQGAVASVAPEESESGQRIRCHGQGDEPEESMACGGGGSKSGSHGRKGKGASWEGKRTKAWAYYTSRSGGGDWRRSWESGCDSWEDGASWREGGASSKETSLAVPRDERDESARKDLASRGRGRGSLGKGRTKAATS